MNFSPVFKKIALRLLYCPLLLMTSLSGENCASGIEFLTEAPYGFSFVDLELSAQELADFDAIDIRGDYYYQRFGELSKLETEIALFLHAIGNNDLQLSQCISFTLTELTERIVELSQRETAWVHMRSSLPTDAYDIPRWHLDGHYFTPSSTLQSTLNVSEPMYKFAMTLLGPSTLFYPLGDEARQTALEHLRDRKFMQSFCHEDRVISPSAGEGAFFIAGRRERSALHSEPPIHENRLFFSIVPCSQKQLKELEAKVRATYPK